MSNKYLKIRVKGQSFLTKLQLSKFYRLESTDIHGFKLFGTIEWGAMRVCDHSKDIEFFMAQSTVLSLLHVFLGSPASCRTRKNTQENGV